MAITVSRVSIFIGTPRTPTSSMRAGIIIVISAKVGKLAIAMLLNLPVGAFRLWLEDRSLMFLNIGFSKLYRKLF
jgi:hypothetical protein